MLVGKGAGYSRRIALLSPHKRTALRIRILLDEKGDWWLPDNVELLARLHEAGKEGRDHGFPK
jgi:hypothetical protein